MSSLRPIAAGPTERASEPAYKHVMLPDNLRHPRPPANLAARSNQPAIAELSRNPVLYPKLFYILTLLGRASVHTKMAVKKQS